MSKYKKYLICFIGIVVLALAGCLYWYFKVHRNTPEYALERLQYAVEQHDKELFYEYADVTSILNKGYESILTMLIESGDGEETKTAAIETVKMLKAPMLIGFRKAVDDYLASGSWDSVIGQTEEETTFDMGEIIVQSGVKHLTFRGLGDIKESENGAVAAILKAYQNDLEREFAFEVILEKTESGSWKVTEIRNFSEFVMAVESARNEKIRAYMEESAEIWRAHEATMRDADFDFQRIIGAKNLGKQGTRGELKALMTDRVAKDWQIRKEELEALTAPKEVESLHKLRLKICGLHIEYAEGYANWLDDKKAITLKVAEDKIKQAKTLEQEAMFLEKRISKQ